MSAAVVQLVPGPTQTRAAGGIGASEAAAAIGVNPYTPPIKAWRVLTGRDPAFEGNEATFWGQTLEAVIRAHYVERNGVIVHVPPTSLWHPMLPWLKAMPDGIVINENHEQLYVAPQVKSVGLRQADRWRDEQVPEEYIIQAVVEMAVTGLERLDFAVLIGAQQYEQRTVLRDRELEEMVLEQLGVFWRCVEEDRAPALDDSDAYRSHLLKQIKRKAIVEASPSDIITLERWRELVIEQKKLKLEEKRVKNLVAAVLAAADANTLSSDLGDIKIGAARKKTAYKSACEAMAPALSALALVERELAALRADVVDDAPAAAVFQRLEALRAGVRLVRSGGLDSYEDLITSHTDLGDPVMNRPRRWTAGIVDLDESEED